MKYSEHEMAALISEVETQFADHLKKAEAEQANLKKTEEVVVAAPKVEVPIAEPIAKSEECDYNDEDKAEVDKLYKSMSKQEAEIHYKSLKKALFGEEIQKTEEPIIDLKKVEEEKLLKSENENLKKENDELKKTTDKLTVALNKFLTEKAPKQKAVTSIEYVKKTEEIVKEVEKVDVSKLKPEDITKKLSEKVRSGKLEKADRENILNFYDKKVSIDAIKHLL